MLLGSWSHWAGLKDKQDALGESNCFDSSNRTILALPLAFCRGRHVRFCSRFRLCDTPLFRHLLPGE